MSPLNNSKTICKLLKLTFSEGGQETKAFNTSNLVQHLQSRCYIYKCSKRIKQENQETEAKQFHDQKL